MPISRRGSVSDTTPSSTATPTSRSDNGFAAKVATLPRRHGNDYSLWQGPCGAGPLGGITQSMIVRFLSCRERFRLKYVLGLEPHDKWNKNVGYGNMWHACEEALAELDAGECSDGAPQEWWEHRLKTYAQNQMSRYPLQREEIIKWYNVCCVQFPEYVRFWYDHPDVKNRTPLLQEQVFDVPYTLPSGRVVRLRGKQDSVDLLVDDVTGPRGGIYLQENKTKGDIDKLQVERQLKFDLQTMLYIVALEEHIKRGNEGIHSTTWQGQGILGVRYNVVRRPLSGGKGNITPHKAKSTKSRVSKKDGRVLHEGKSVPAETDEHFYERLRHDYIAADPAYWFFRVRTEVSARDLQVFRNTCFDPILEQLCCWYDTVTGKPTPIPTHAVNYRTPFGVYSALEENGATEYDSFLDNGSEVGLRRVEELFTELK